MKTVLDILRRSERYLAERGVAAPRVDSEWLLAHVLGLSRLDVYLQFERPLRESELAALRLAVKRRGAGEPLQYITGSTEFYNVEIQVGPGVLIPRPETERLVELALARLTGPGDVLDLCTGSGAVVLALAKARPATPRLTGVDLSADALAWAERNRAALNLEPVAFVCGDLYAPVAGRRFALISANPPYVTTEELATLPREVGAFEPTLALHGGTDGLDVLRRVVAGAPAHLEPHGWLLCEIGWRQGPAVAELFRAAGLTEVEVCKDYGRRDRVVCGRQPA